MVNGGAAHTDVWDPAILPFASSRRTIVYRPGGAGDNPKLLGIHQVHATPPPGRSSYHADWCDRLLADPAEVTAAVSDASFKRSSRNVHSLFSLQEPPPDHAMGAFVLLSWIRPVLGVQITGMDELVHYNPFVGELYAGVALAQLRSYHPHAVDTWMDCKSVLDASGESSLPATSEYYANLQEDYSPLLHHFFRLRKGTNQPPVRWTRGHPD